MESRRRSSAEGVTRECDVVYVVQGGWGGPVKIGVAGHRALPGRMRALQTGYPVPLRLLMVWRPERGAARAEEAALHEVLRPHRMQGEWFDNTHPEVASTIKRIMVDAATEFREGEARAEFVAGLVTAPLRLKGRLEVPEHLERAAVAAAMCLFANPGSAVLSVPFSDVAAERLAFPPLRGTNPAKERDYHEQTYLASVTADEVPRKTPGDGEFMRLMEDVEGPTPNGGRCRVRVFLPEDARNAPVVVCTEPRDNPGQSVTDAAARIAGEVIDAFSLPVPVVWIEHHEDGTRGSERDPHTFDLVLFSHYEVEYLRPHRGETRKKIGEPTWKRLDRASAEALVGGPL